MAPLILLAGAFAVAGVALLARAFTRRRSSERRRLASLGTVESHREARPNNGD